MKKSVNKFHLS